MFAARFGWTEVSPDGIVRAVVHDPVAFWVQTGDYGVVIWTGDGRKDRAVLAAQGQNRRCIVVIR
jgi:hypothetical protein